MAHVMVRFDMLVKDESTGTKARLFDERYLCDHGTLCRAFGLDPVRTKFDLPDSWRGLGSQRGDGRHGGGRIRNGLVLFYDHEKRDHVEIGKVTIMREGEKIRDVDPLDPSAFYDLDAMR
jgi:hypothetical protein